MTKDTGGSHFRTMTGDSKWSDLCQYNENKLLFKQTLSIAQGAYKIHPPNFALLFIKIIITMDSTHLHLLLNHFPVIGTIIGTLVMAYGYFTNSASTKKAALLTWVLMALFTIPVFLTGEPAEESVENLPGVSEAIIHDHEEAAELAIWAMGAVGLLSLIALLAPAAQEKAAKTMIGIAFVLSLVSFGLMARTGYLGGQIRHTEIRSGVAAATGAEGQPEAEAGGAEAEKDDDD